MAQNKHRLAPYYAYTIERSQLFTLVRFRFQCRKNMRLKRVNNVTINTMFWE